MAMSAGSRRPAEVKVAQYVRASTEHQKYSIVNQTDLIAQHAVVRGYTIVRTYADEGRSGITFRGRPALQQLMADVEKGPDFSRVVVLDISRWGRFLDADESAYYEFVCRQHSVEVEYCSEQLNSDSPITNSVMKAIRRAMAAEFSRELSRKVLQGHRRLASLGFWQGGPAPFGMRRLLIDEEGLAERVLMRGQRKALTTERVTLVPGPISELEIVQFVFLAFCRHRLSPTLIARAVNYRPDVDTADATWTGVRIKTMLQRPAYAGDLVFSRTTRPLGGPVVANPREEWIVAKGVWTPVVPRMLFDKAQRLMRDFGHASGPEQVSRFHHTLLHADRRGMRYVAAFLNLEPQMLPARLVISRGATGYGGDRQKVVRCHDERQGWLGRWQVGSHHREQFFDDGDFGSCAKARRAAVTWLKDERRKIAEQRHLASRLSLRRNNSSGGSGVARRAATQQKSAVWIAFWTHPNGARKSRSFSVAKYGEAEARARALRARYLAMRVAAARFALLRDALSLPSR